MKIATFDDGFYFDDPNLIWGDPSYQLEPGDPGYVPVPVATPVQTQKKTRRKNMPKSDYIHQNDAAFAGQLMTCKDNLGGYATLLGVSTAQLATLAADAAYYAYVVACQQTMQNAAQQWTAWRDYIRDGGTPPSSGKPLAPTLPDSVDAVLMGIEARFRALVKQIKASAGYNEAIGEALGIEGAAQTGPDLSTIQPDFSVSLVGGQVFVDWTWQGQSQFLDAFEVQVDRGDGKGYALLAHDTTPGYTDTQPLPAAPGKWTYRGIYRVGDDRVGQWSNPVSVMVG